MNVTITNRREPGSGRRPRVVLFGMRCAFTLPVLAALAASPEIDLAAVVLPGAIPTPARTGPDPVLDAIDACRIRLIPAPARADLSRAPLRATLEDVAPDAIVVACFPWRLPGWLLALPPRGCLNLHPSLLPAGRGPEPVFWAFHRGLDETGVTLHLMNETFDAGPIISQVRVRIPGDATLPSLEGDLAVTGARMVIDHLRTAPDEMTAPSAQREANAWYAPMPRHDDLTVPTAWDARRAARFITAVAPVYGPIPVVIQASGRRLAVEQVVAFEEGVVEAGSIVIRGDIARIRFANGTVTCRLRSDAFPLRLHR